MTLATLSLDQSGTGGALVISARGEIDRSTAPALSDALRRATFAGSGPVTLDLREVTFMDSSGISVLLNALRRLTRRGRRLSLVCARGELLRLFQLTGLVETLDVHTAPDEALAGR